MRKLLNKPWFVALMAVAAIGFVVNSLYFQGHGLGLPDLGGSDTVAAETPPGTATTSAWWEVKKISIPMPSRDPFAIRVKEDPTLIKTPEPDLVDTIHLSAVWTQEGQTLLLINDRIFRNGDEIGRIKIDAVTRDGVWLSHWKGRDFVRVGGSFTLNTPAGETARVASSL